MSSQGQAIPFITKNPLTQQYQLSHQAQQFLKSIHTPLSIVTVAGLYRTGKSYLLNRVILNRGGGFSVGPTINPCTKGLLIWNKPILTQDNKTILVVDTEGLGALDQETNHDMKIFSLAVLLSTTFIYNSVGNIDQNALQTLSLVLNLVGNIDNQQQSLRPSFVWVVRDFSLQLVDEKGNTISPKQYLQMALNSDGMKQSQKLQIRKNITKAFSDRDCFTLYKPLIDENKLQKLDTIPIEQLRPQFVSQTMALRKKIFNNLKQIKLSNGSMKKNQARGLKGSEYIVMIKKYLMAINNGKVPNMIDTWTYIKQQKGRQVTQQLSQIYTQKIKHKILSKLPLKFHIIQQIITSLWQQIKSQFISATYQQTSLQQIQQFFMRMKQQIKKQNQDQMKNMLKNLLNKQFQSFSKKMYSDYYSSIDVYVNDIEKNYKQMLLSAYSDKLEGLNASISSFLQKKYIEAFKYFSSKMILQIKKLQSNQQQIQNSYKRQLQTQKTNSTQYINQLKSKITQLDQQILLISRSNQQNQKYLQTQKRKSDERSKQVNSKIQQLNQTLQQLKQQKQILFIQKTRLDKEIFMIKKQNDKEIALLKQKNQYLSKQYEEQSSRYEELKKMLDQKMINYQQQKKKFFSSNEYKMKMLLQQNQSKSDKIYELQQKLLQLKEQYNQKFDKFSQRQHKLLQQKQQIKQNLINDFSNKKQTHIHQLQNLREQCRKYQDQLQLNLYQKTQLQNKYRQLSQQLKHIKYSSQKQIAIHLQRIQFYQVEIKQLKSNNQDIKKNFQAMIENIQSSAKINQEKYVKKINQITEQYEGNYKIIEKDYSEKIYELKKQLQTIKATKEDLHIQLSLERKRFENKQKQFKQSYSKLQSMYKGLNQKFNNSQKDFHDLSHQKQIYFTMRIKQLERQVEQVKQKSMRQLQQTQRSSEQALAVLKNYTEIQRHQWQKRLSDEKQKNNKKLISLKDQYEKKILQQKQILQQQNSMLQQKIDQMQKFFNQTLQNMKYDHDIQIQKMSNSFMQQKQQINKKNALLSQQIQLTKMNMQNQIDQMKRNYQQNINNLKRQLQNQLRQQQIKYKQEKQFIENKYQTLKKTNKTVEQQNLLLKNQLDKQKLLYRQKQSNYLKNINDLQQRLSTQLFNHTKTIQQITNAHNIERRRLNNQIDSLKCMKSRLQDQKSSIQIQKQAIQTKLNSKITYLQNKIKTNKNDYDDLMNKFELTSNFLNKKIQSMKKQKQDLNSRIKVEFDQQISIKEDNYKKQIKQFNDRMYRLQGENKSLRDKVILLEVKINSQSKHNQQQENNGFEEIEIMKEQYQKRQEEYRKVIQKLKRQIKKLKQQKQILQATQNYQKQKNVNHYQRNHFKQRDSIINGLNEYSNNNNNQNNQNNTRIDYSRINHNNTMNNTHLDNSKMHYNNNMDNSKIMNMSNIQGNNFNQSRVSVLGDKNIYTHNRKSNVNVSPISTMKKYSNNNYQQDDYNSSSNRYY